MGRGPLGLGRSVLVRTDQPTPSEWEGCRRISAVDFAAAVSSANAMHPTTLDLHRAWTRREALVIEADEAPAVGTRVTGDEFWQLEPTTEPTGERALFYASANAVDLRGSEPRFAQVDTALQHGAKPIESDGDVCAPNGVAVWLDGGPLEWLDLGSHAIPRLHLAQGTFRQLKPQGSLDTALAEDQRAAVAHRRGSARIIAPAGSGKTRVLTERLRHLIRGGLSPNAATLVAYNVRAQEEMQHRLRDISGVKVSTLHALARRICVAAEVSEPAAKVLNERERRQRLEQLIPKLVRRANQDPLEEWVDAVNTCRDRLIPPSDAELMFDGVDGLEPVVVGYRRLLRERLETDFSDMVLRASEYLLASPSFTAQIRAETGVLLVDEFQDLTPSLLLLTRLLAGPAQEVFCVGDDDQTIYGFSGASPRWLVDFNTFFPGSHTHFLATNYRCPRGIVDATNNLLRHNEDREPKTIRAAETARSGGLTVEPAHDSLTTNEAMARSITKCIEDGARASEIAVLARTNPDLIAPFIFLNSHGVRVQPPPGLTPDLLKRSGIESLMAWLDLAASTALSAESLELSLRRPKRQTTVPLTRILVSKRSVREIRQFVSRNSNRKLRESLTDWCDSIDAVRAIAQRGGTTREIVDFLLDTVGISESADTLDSSQRTARRATHRDQLEAIRAVASLEPNASRFRAFLQHHLSPERLNRRIGGDTVTLETVHRVKGLEWQHVHIVGVAEGSFPHRLSEDIEEERRIFHVAMTRASHEAIVWAQHPTSRFILELTGASQKKQREKPQPAVVTDSPQSATPPSTAKPNAPSDEALFKTLKTWRLSKAKESGVPAFVVAHDSTLRAIARLQPRTRPELRNVPGWGEKRDTTWGDEILEVVRRHRSSEP